MSQAATYPVRSSSLNTMSPFNLPHYLMQIKSYTRTKDNLRIYQMERRRRMKQRLTGRG
jgi:hypothetical protein